LELDYRPRLEMTDSIRKLRRSALLVAASVLALAAGSAAAADFPTPVGGPPSVEVPRDCWTAHPLPRHCSNGPTALEDLVLPVAPVGAQYDYRFGSAQHDDGFESDEWLGSVFSVGQGDLPDGLSLDADGLLHGVPTTAGRSSFVVEADDWTGGTEQHVVLDVIAPPGLTLAPPQNVGLNGALLGGRVRPGNAATDAWFEYWPTADPNPRRTAVEPIARGVEPVELNVAIAGLTPGTDYSFRLAASSGFGPNPVHSATGTLRTADPVVVVAAAVREGLPPPVAGKTFNIAPLDGIVTTSCASESVRKLEKPRQVTLDCQIDAERGTVSVTASKGSSGETQTAAFWGGLFDIDQEAGDDREAVMTLAGQRRCEKRAGSMGNRRILSRSGGGGRRLWGSGSGNYKTAGSHGSATVRGTIWLVADRCDGSTLFKVRKGTVVVRDFIKKSSVVIEAGQSYVARVAIDRLP